MNLQIELLVGEVGAKAPSHDNTALPRRLGRGTISLPNHADVMLPGQCGRDARSLLSHANNDIV
jgi:hypothetical protein